MIIAGNSGADFGGRSRQADDDKCDQGDQGVEDVEVQMPVL